jgi:hypothetical protein
MSPLGRGHGAAAAVIVATSGGADGELLRLGDGGSVASVRLTQAAGRNRRSRDRQRKRNQLSGKRDQQQESGGQALHSG